MNETDLPCSDCGTELVARTLPARNLPVSTDVQGTIQVAVCPSCGAHYYPSETLSRLAGEADTTPSEGEL